MVGHDGQQGIDCCQTKTVFFRTKSDVRGYFKRCLKLDTIFVFLILLNTIKKYVYLDTTMNFLKLQNTLLNLGETKVQSKELFLFKLFESTGRPHSLRFSKLLESVRVWYSRILTSNSNTFKHLIILFLIKKI